jgi:HSP20 family molecular chaperone IbpA
MAALIPFMWFSAGAGAIGVADGIKNYISSYFATEEEYDMVLNITSLDEIKTGWQMTVHKKYADQYASNVNDNAGANRTFSFIKFKGVFVSVVGMFNKGKTYFINKLVGSNLPSSTIKSTKGISFIARDNKNFTIIDTAGSNAPVFEFSDVTLDKRKETEAFLQELAFTLADVIVIVANDLTWQEQLLIQNIARELKGKALYIIHNFKDSQENNNFFTRRNIVQQIFNNGTKYPPNAGDSEYYSWITYYDNSGTNHSLRHYFLAEESSDIGRKFNKRTFEEINKSFAERSQDIKSDENRIPTNLQSVLNHHFEVMNDFVIEGDRKNGLFLKVKGETKKRNVSFEVIGSLVRIKQAEHQYEIGEDKNYYYVTIDLQGSIESSVKVNRKEDTVTVIGEVIKQYSNEAIKIFSNRNYGHWKNIFVVPKHVDSKQMNAKFANGVIKITFRLKVDDNVDIPIE